MAIISKTYGRLLTVIMAWLGFSCEPDHGGGMCPDYGVSSATYKAKGTVVSQTDDVPIEGIRAVLKAEPDATWGMDTVYTNSKGVFNLKGFDFSNKLYVELTDIDGEKNGSFNNKDIEVDFSHIKYKGSDWERGEVEKDLGIIKLTPKE